MSVSCVALVCSFGVKCWSEEKKEGMGEVMRSYIRSSGIDGVGC